MSLSSLINVNTVLHQPYTGQNKSTGAQEYGVISIIKGRFGEAKTRFDTQEAIDNVANASFTTFSVLELQDRIIFGTMAYSITDKNVIRKGNGSISHYNYTIKTLDNVDTAPFYNDFLALSNLDLLLTSENNTLLIN
jgi:hypothetical protein